MWPSVTSPDLDAQTSPGVPFICYHYHHALPPTNNLTNINKLMISHNYFWRHVASREIFLFPPQATTILFSGTWAWSAIVGRSTSPRSDRKHFIYLSGHITIKQEVLSQWQTSTAISPRAPWVHMNSVNLADPCSHGGEYYCRLLTRIPN